jgi:PAS domain S-box-containing protein
MKKENIIIPQPLMDKWQKVVDTMSEILDVPAGLIMKVDPPYLEVFKSSRSTNNPYKEGQRDLWAGLYCEATINSNKKLLVPNALTDSHWEDDNLDVKLGMISYLGFPLLWPDGDVFGTICVLDSKTNPYNKHYINLLQRFKELIESDLELIVSIDKLDKLNQELRDTKNTGTKLKDALDLARLGQWKLDLPTKKLQWSREVYELFEVDPNQTDLTYNTFLKMIHPDDREAVDFAYSKSLEDRKSYDNIHRLLMKDGRVKYVRELCRTKFDDNGNPLVSRGTVQDITLLKKQEEELREANERLKEMDRLKSVFIASMSHELRTPLNSIIGFSGLMLNGAKGEPKEAHKDFIKRIEKAGHHLLSLITDVIDISKIESGRLKPASSSFFLEEVIAEAIDLTRTEAERKRLTFDIRVPSGIEMKTDRKRFLQCLINYLSNAAKYTEKGEIIITAIKKDDRILVEVADTGIGIAETDKSLIFKPFERLESPLRVQAGGTGLGLHLTNKIATEILQGTTDFESEEGTGSRFWLEVPRILISKSSRGSIMTKALVIEDNPDNMLLIDELLKAAGFSVQKTMTGLDGVEMARTQKPDFILLDIQLPDIDGFEVLKRLREHKESKDIPVVALTASTMSGDKDRLLAGGCAGYIEKPIDPSRVIDQILEVIEK